MTYTRRIVQSNPEGTRYFLSQTTAMRLFEDCEKNGCLTNDLLGGGRITGIALVEAESVAITADSTNCWQGHVLEARGFDSLDDWWFCNTCHQFLVRMSGYTQHIIEEAVSFA